MRRNYGRIFLSYYSHLLISVCVTLCSIRLCGGFERMYYYFENGACPRFMCYDTTSFTPDQYIGLHNGSINCIVSIVWKYYTNNDRAGREIISSSVGSEKYSHFFQRHGVFFPKDRHGEGLVRITKIYRTEQYVGQTLSFRDCRFTDYYFRFGRGMEQISHLVCNIKYSCYENISVDIHHFINHTDKPQVPISHTVSLSPGFSQPHRVTSTCSANKLGNGTLTIFKRKPKTYTFQFSYFDVLNHCLKDSCSFSYSVDFSRPTRKLMCMFIHDTQKGDHHVFFSLPQRVPRGPLALTPLYNKAFFGNAYQRVFEGQEIHLECTATESVGIIMYWQEKGEIVDCNEPTFDECNMSLVHVSKPIDTSPGYINEYLLTLSFRPNRRFTHRSEFYSWRQFTCVANGPDGKLTSSSKIYLVHKEILPAADDQLYVTWEHSFCIAYTPTLAIVAPSIIAAVLFTCATPLHAV